MTGFSRLAKESGIEDLLKLTDLALTQVARNILGGLF